MLFSILLIEDKKSKSTISQAVSRAIVDLRKHHPGCMNNSDKRIDELKGSKELQDCPDVRLRFFKRISKKSNYRIYTVILDKRRIQQKLPINYMERYSMLFLNILTAIPIPKDQKWITMIVDSQARAEPTQPLKVRYASKSKRLRQKSIRAGDINRRNQFTNMITYTFKQVLKKHGTHLAVWHVRSKDDRCIQAVDVVVNFFYQRLNLYEKRLHLFHRLSPSDRHPGRLLKNKQWQEIEKERTSWFESYEVIKPHIKLIRKPRHLLRRQKYLGRKRISNISKPHQ